MTDREALYRAILDAPDDDAPRLVYADWLDEHGDPDRGEFIRLQCELNQLVIGTGEGPDRYTDIRNRCTELLSAHHRQWVKE